MSAEHIRQRYGVLLRRYTQTGGEAELAALATLGRDAISIDLPPEEIGAIHNAALADLVATSAEPKLSEIIESTSLPLIEVLMAYGLAFREEAARRDAVGEALKSSEELYRQMFRSNRALQLLIDPNDGAIVDANPAAEDYYLPSTGEMKGLRLTDITADADEFLERALGEARRESQGHLVFRHRLGDGSLRDVEVYSSHVTIKGRSLLHWIVHDITDRKRNEATIHHLATHDALTDLANRSLFQERLQEALAAAGRAQHHVAVIFVDLDRFKDVNDTLGHPVGDLLLKEVAQRLRICARFTDTVARLGGDEFALIATNVHQVADATVLATRIIESLAQPFMLDTHHVYSGASVGITLYPTDGKDADHLIKNADLALYRAKKNGRETYQFYKRLIPLHPVTQYEGATQLSVGERVVGRESALCLGLSRVAPLRA